jgi:hypothetical protein
MNADVLSRLAPQFEGWSDANLHVVLILRHGKLVYARSGGHCPVGAPSAVSRIMPV